MDAFSKIEQIGEAEQRRAWRIGVIIFYIVLITIFAGVAVYQSANQ